MKSHELAKILLSNPDLEIYYYSDYEKGYHTVGEKLLVTPSGLFMTRSHEYNHIIVRSPYEQPMLGHMQIFFKDGTITPKQEGYERKNVMHMEYGVLYHIPHEKNIILVTDENDIEEHKKYNPNSIIFTKDDIDYISVLTEYDPSTWHETWEEMTFDQALQCGKDLAKQLYPEKETLTQEQVESFTADYPDAEFNINVQNNDDIVDIIKTLDNEGN